MAHFLWVLCIFIIIDQKPEKRTKKCTSEEEVDVKKLQQQLTAWSLN